MKQPTRDRAVDVAFGSEMQHRIGLVLIKHLHRRDRRYPRARTHSSDGQRLRRAIWIRGVGQLVSIDHRRRRPDQPPARRGPDEPCPSGDQHAHEALRLNRKPGQYRERRQTSVPFRNHRLDRRDRPFDAQARIRPVNAAVVIGGIDLVDLIENYAIGLQRAEAVSKSSRDQELIPCRLLSSIATCFPKLDDERRRSTATSKMLPRSTRTSLV